MPISEKEEKIENHVIGLFYVFCLLLCYDFFRIDRGEAWLLVSKWQLRMNHAPPNIDLADRFTRIYNRNRPIPRGSHALHAYMCCREGSYIISWMQTCQRPPSLVWWDFSHPIVGGFFPSEPWSEKQPSGTPPPPTWRKTSTGRLWRCWNTRLFLPGMLVYRASPREAVKEATKGEYWVVWRRSKHLSLICRGLLWLMM